MDRNAFELSLEVVGDGRNFSMSVNRRGAAGRALCMAERFSAHIDAMVSNPDTPLCSSEHLRHPSLSL
jgi:hypothetical protein